VFHLGVGGFVLAGWLVTSFETLTFYLVLLPAMAGQWAINRRTCVVNNLESWLRTGRWHDPRSREEGGFLLMICDWLFALRPSAVAIDRFSYSVVFFFWVLGLLHLFWLVPA
jgi:hypothetical protein